MIIVQLSKQVQKMRANNPSDIMEIFETYLQEIKEENKKLQSTFPLHVRKNDHMEDEQTSEQEIPAEEGEAVSDTQQDTSEPTPPDVQINDQFETSIQARVLQLYDLGYTVEQIAQALDCGTTEAALIIKLHKK